MRIKTLNSSTITHLIKTDPISLYPKHHTPSDVIAQAKAQLPITTANDLVAILATYRNSLINSKDISHDPTKH